MIWESSDWKEPLLKSANWLSRKRLSETTRESTYVKIEKEAMIGFYSVRKLLDTCKVSDSKKKDLHEISWFPNKNPVHLMNWEKVDQLYNLLNEKRECRNARFICDRFIHSYVFLISENQNRLNGFYVATDRDKDSRVYFISLKTVLNIFRAVGNDYPANMRKFTDPKNGELKYEVW